MTKMDLGSSPLGGGNAGADPDSAAQADKASALMQEMERQQGPLQSIKTAIKKSSIAGEMARQTAQQLADSKARIAGTAIGIFENETVKSMVASSAARAAALTERVAAQETLAHGRIDSLGAEAIARNGLQWEAQRRKYEALLASGEVSQETFDSMIARKYALAQMSANASDTAVVAALHDTVAYFAPTHNKT